MVCLLDDDDDDDDDGLGDFIGDAEFVPFPLPVDGFGVAGFGGGIVSLMRLLPLLLLLVVLLLLLLLLFSREYLLWVHVHLCGRPRYFLFCWYATRVSWYYDPGCDGLFFCVSYRFLRLNALFKNSVVIRLLSDRPYSSVRHFLFLGLFRVWSRIVFE